MEESSHALKSEFELLAEHLCAAPGMYLHAVTYSAACAFLTGFDVARDGGPLIGFREWLIVQCNSGNNLAWTALVLERLKIGLSDEDVAIRGLGIVLCDYFEYKRTRGVTKIFHEYARWLLRRSWYTGSLRKKSIDPD